MTLIAGFGLGGHSPCLIGDILLSGEGELDVSISVPTFADTSMIYAEGSKLVIKGVSQKIHQVSDNLAIAWSGRHIAARTIVNELIQQNTKGPFTYESLLSYLKNNETIKYNGLKIIAFLFDPKTNNSKIVGNAPIYNSEFFGMIFSAGSGADDFLSMFKSREAGFIECIREQNVGVEGIAASLITQLLASDFTHGPSLSNYYGGGYELLLVDNGKIGKVDDLTYVFWLSQFLEGDDITPPIPVQLHAYKYVKDILAIRALRLKQRDDNSKAVNSSVYFIPPVTRSVSEEEIIKLLSSEASFLNDQTYLSKNFHHIFLIEDNNHYIKMWVHYKSEEATINLVMANENQGMFINTDWSWLFKVRDIVRRQRLSQNNDLSTRLNP